MTGRGFEAVNRSYWKEGVPTPEADGSTPPATADAVIVGAGLTGLAAALHLARAGRSVIVLEAADIGHGCSGRAGGMCGPSFHKLGIEGLARQYGEARAQSILKEGLTSLDHFFSFIEAEKIDCDLQMTGRFRGAATFEEYNRLVRQCEYLADTIGLKFHAVPRENQRAEIGTDLYHGGVVYERDAGINPYKLTAGLAERARAAGTRIFEHCAVEGMNTIPGGQEVRIRDGKIRAKQVIVATNGYTGKALPYFRRRLIPISAGVIATEKIGRKKVLEISPKLRMHGGTHRLVFWYRPSPDGERMIFGGRVMDCKKRPKAISSDLLALARRVFPQMEDVKAEYCWHGDVAYTFDHAPHLGEVNGVHYAMGYCGSGITRALYFGRQIAGQILNEAGSETAHDGLAFDGRPFYTGNPWFMPLVLRWHAVADRIAGH